MEQQEGSDKETHNVMEALKGLSRAMELFPVTIGVI